MLIYVSNIKVVACLVTALIEEKPLQFKVCNNIPPEVVLCNYRLAVDVALEFLSTTQIHTYTANDDGNFIVEQNHPTIKLSFPAGVIEAEEMYISFYKSLASADLRGYPMYVSTISVILHLLYCYCLEKEENNQS